MTKQQAFLNWVTTCPHVPWTGVVFQTATERLESWTFLPDSAVNTPEETDVLGRIVPRDKTYVCTVVMQLWAAQTESTPIRWSTENAQALNQWIAQQSTLGNLPDFPGCTVLQIVCRPEADQSVTVDKTGATIPVQYEVFYKLKENETL